MILTDVNKSFINFLTPSKSVYQLSIAELGENNEGVYVKKEVICNWLFKLDDLYKTNYRKLTLKLKGNDCEILFKRSTQEYVDEFINRLMVFLHQ